MLANFSEILSQSGTLGKDLHLPATFLHALLDFIANELPRWRDDPDRPISVAETTLTEHLCDYLSGAARRSPGWDVLQFRTEVSDEQNKGRKIDAAPKPCGTIIWIDGRRHTQYDSLLPIECKRLPTPKGKDRDEREYVISGHTTTGGIQRFKAGYHGAAHLLGAMIGYVQEDTTMLWYKRVTGWIEDLVKAGESGWTVKDHLHIEHDDRTLRLTVFRSSHDREIGSPIALRHLWLEMN